MYAACGNYIDAKSSCKTALDILEVILDKNDLKIADQLNRLANMDLLLVRKSMYFYFIYKTLLN